MKVDELLTADGDISPDMAAQIARYIEFLTPEEAGLELSALSLEKSPGDTVVAYSRHPRNIRFNWRELLIELVAAGGSAAAASDPVTGLITSAIRSIPKLLKATEVKLSSKHTQAVLALWFDHVTLNPIPADAVSDSLRKRGITDPKEADQILGDLETLCVVRIADDGKVRKMSKLILKPAA